MKITHYLYNAFLLEEGGTKVAIDPGQNLYIFDLRSLIPEEEWPTITHIVITHGDPDHHWQSDRVARASGAPVVCGVGLTKTENGQTLVIDVLTDFSASDDIVISDLSFTGFSAPSASDNLELETANDGSVAASDDKTPFEAPFFVTCQSQPIRAGCIKEETCWRAS